METHLQLPKLWEGGRRGGGGLGGDRGKTLENGVVIWLLFYHQRGEEREEEERGRLDGMHNIFLAPPPNLIGGSGGKIHRPRTLASKEILHRSSALHKLEQEEENEEEEEEEQPPRLAAVRVTHATEEAAGGSGVVEGVGGGLGGGGEEVLEAYVTRLLRSLDLAVVVLKRICLSVRLLCSQDGATVVPLHFEDPGRQGGGWRGGMGNSVSSMEASLRRLLLGRLGRWVIEWEGWTCRSGLVGRRCRLMMPALMVELEEEEGSCGSLHRKEEEAFLMGMRRCLRWMKRSRRWGSRQMKFRNFPWCLSKAVRMACTPAIAAASAWRISKRAKRRNSSRAPTPSIRFVFRNGSKNMWCVRCVGLTAGRCSPATSVRHNAPIQKNQTQVLNPYLVVHRVGTCAPRS
jgi:hypothetical protein